MTTEPPSQPAPAAPEPAPAAPAADAQDPRSKRIEIWIAALLGVVTIVTAFATYKAVLEDGDTLANFNEGIRINNDATSEDDEGTQQYTTDQAIYLEFVKSDVGGDHDVAKYFRTTLFSPELEEGVKWVEEGGKDAVSPFQDESPYVRPEYAKADKLRAKSRAKFSEARVHDEDGDKYVLATVILSISLFLLGIAGVNRQYRVQLALTLFASLVMIAGLVRVVTVMS